MKSKSNHLMTAPALSMLALSMMACSPAMEGEFDSPTTDAIDFESSDQGLVGGTTTSLRPEVGRFLNGRGGSCTATLIHERYVLAAAHCLDYPNYDNVVVPSGALFRTGSNSYSVDRIHSFAYARYEYTQSGDRTTDVVLLRLSTAVPTSVATPARLADRPPNNNERVTIFGFGCTQRSPESGGGGKQYFEFNYGSNTQALCPGDSGGPVFLGSRTAGGNLWGVNSDYAGSGNFNNWNDIFGDITGLKLQIEAIIRQWEGGDLEPGYDRPGADYNSFTDYTSNVAACRSACLGDSRCRSFTYREPTSSQPYGYCWLKERIPGMRPATGFTSGTAGRINSGVGFTGGYRTFSANPARAETCAQQCTQESSCRSWDYRSNTTICTLSSLNKSPTSCTQCASGLLRPAREDNTDRWGNDYRSFTTSSASICEDTCASEAQCKAWTLVSSRTRCYLKDAEGSPRSYTGATSGKKRGLDVNTDRPGNDYRSFTPSSPSAAICQATCAAESACKAWTYVPPTSGSARCYLKNATPWAYSTTGMASGWHFMFFGINRWVLDPPNTDRNGGDYRSFAPSPNAATTCESTCQGETVCRAWTYVPATATSGARCYLKNTVVGAYNTTNMISGLKGQEFLR